MSRFSDKKMNAINILSKQDQEYQKIKTGIYTMLKEINGTLVSASIVVGCNKLDFSTTEDKKVIIDALNEGLKNIDKQIEENQERLYRLIYTELPEESIDEIILMEEK